ncbi:replication protein [Morganella psychrotolerans]|uniref:replication protein n=1 Tax=Morganella psychrotolerans TaxID=368603 RepID=UPI001F179B82|nr:replication protein [Morganella psychrotolerans]
MASLDDGFYRTATSIGRLKSKLKMSGQEHQVFDAVIMCTFGWNKSEDKVTNTYIADMTDLDDSDVSKALNKLANRRIINLRKSGLFKIISVNKKLDEWVLSRQKTEKAKSPKRLGETTQEVGRFDLSSLVKSPNTKDSLTKDNKDLDTPISPKPKKSTGTESLDAVNHPIPEWLNRDTWISWVTYRKDLKKPIKTKQTLNGLITKLTKCYEAGHTPESVIDESISNGWTGLFMPKSPPARKSVIQPKPSQQFIPEDF